MAGVHAIGNPAGQVINQNSTVATITHKQKIISRVITKLVDEAHHILTRTARIITEIWLPNNMCRVHTVTNTTRQIVDQDSGGAAIGDKVTIITPQVNSTPAGILPRLKRFTVVGVFQVGMSEYDQTFVYMPLKQAQLFFNRGDGVDYIEVKLDNVDLAPAIKPALTDAGGRGAIVSDWTEKNQAYFGALQVEHNAMEFVFSLLVMIAGLLILSALVMLVKNKGHDIAILRTMGASRGAILRIFVMCGGILGGAGALCGLVGGLLFCWNIGSIQSFVEWVTHAQVFNPSIYFLTRVPAKIVWSEVGFTVGFAVVVALLAALIPASIASRLDPVEALRNE